jgi:phage shock protein A
MNIFKRFSDILSANTNEWADQFEEPEIMLRQAVREMAEAIDDSTQQTAKSMANEKLLVKELARNRTQCDTWQSRAEKAVEAGDDDMARNALTRKNEYHSLVQALEDQLEVARTSSRTLQRQLAAMKAKLSEAQRNLATLSARKRAADFRKKLDRQALTVGAEPDQSAFAKFDRLQAKVEQAEAEAEAMSELRGRHAGAEPDDIEEIPGEEFDISAELSDLKRKVKNS